jgi:hypothetical protein
MDFCGLSVTTNEQHRLWKVMTLSAITSMVIHVTLRTNQQQDHDNDDNDANDANDDDEHTNTNHTATTTTQQRRQQQQHHHANTLRGPARHQFLSRTTTCHDATCQSGESRRRIGIVDTTTTGATIINSNNINVVIVVVIGEYDMESLISTTTRTTTFT